MTVTPELEDHTCLLQVITNTEYSKFQNIAMLGISHDGCIPHTEFQMSMFLLEKALLLKLILTMTIHDDKKLLQNSQLKALSLLPPCK